MTEREERTNYRILCAKMGMMPLPGIVPVDVMRNAYKGMKEIYDRDMERERIKALGQKKHRVINPHFEKVNA